MKSSREQFEEWFPAMGDGMPENMVKIFDEMLFTAWQESRAAIVIELPDPHAYMIWVQAGHAPDDYWDEVIVSHSKDDRCCDGSERYPVYADWEIEKALESTGLKVKS